MEIRARLDKNESPLDVPESIKNRMIELARQVSFNRYEGSYMPELLGALASNLGVLPENIMLGNGADECILVTALAFGGPGVSMIIPSPSFIVYPQAAVSSHSTIVDIPRLLPDFGLDMDAIVLAAESAGRKRKSKKKFSAVVFLCRPNNPTGNLCPEEDIKRLLSVPGLLVVLDEAYSEISGVSLLPWINEHENLLVLRTFSKAYCIAGLRVGYAVGQPDLIQQLNHHRPYYNVNVFSQAAALVALKEKNTFMRWAKEIAGLTTQLQQDLSAIPGVTALPTVTNFVLVKTPVPASVVCAALRQRGIIVTQYPAEKALSHHFRVSTGTREENALFLKELDTVLRSSP